ELEDESCLRRLEPNRASQATKEAYCANEDWPGRTGPLPPPADQPVRPRALRQLYRASRFFEPEVTDPQGALQLPPLAAEEIPATATSPDFSARGYSFDPKTMWNIFVLGAAQAQQRCAEVREVLGWHIDCDGNDFRSTLEDLHASLSRAGCYRKALQVTNCPRGTRPLSAPPLPQAVIY